MLYVDHGRAVFTSDVCDTYKVPFYQDDTWLIITSSCDVFISANYSHLSRGHPKTHRFREANPPEKLGTPLYSSLGITEKMHRKLFFCYHLSLVCSHLWCDDPIITRSVWRLKTPLLASHLFTLQQGWPGMGCFFLGTWRFRKHEGDNMFLVWMGVKNWKVSVVFDLGLVVHDLNPPFTHHEAGRDLARSFSHFSRRFTCNGDAFWRSVVNHHQAKRHVSVGWSEITPALVVVFQFSRGRDLHLSLTEVTGGIFGAITWSISW